MQGGKRFAIDMAALKTILSGMGILALLLSYACAGSRVSQTTLPLSQKNREDPRQSREEKTEPFTFEQDEPNIYM